MEKKDSLRSIKSGLMSGLPDKDILNKQNRIQCQWQNWDKNLRHWHLNRCCTVKATCAVLPSRYIGKIYQCFSSGEHLKGHFKEYWIIHLLHYSSDQASISQQHCNGWLWMGCKVKSSPGKSASSIQASMASLHNSKEWNIFERQMWSFDLRDRIVKLSQVKLMRSQRKGANGFDDPMWHYTAFMTPAGFGISKSRMREQLSLRHFS